MQYVINVDLVDVWSQPGREGLLRTLGWGDKITLAQQTDDYVEIETVFYDEQDDGSVLPVKQKGYIEPTKSSRRKIADIIRPIAKNDVLKVNFVDVQQGDAAVIESPDGKVILVDGGDNQLFARYLAGRFRETTANNPQPIECLLVTHGDADHFAGLTEIYKSETNKTGRKRFFMQPKRYYHNGIVKRPGKKNGKSVPDLELLGPTNTSGAKLHLTGLEQNLLQVPDGELNAEFLEWKKRSRSTIHGRQSNFVAFSLVITKRSISSTKATFASRCWDRSRKRSMANPRFLSCMNHPRGRASTTNPSAPRPTSLKAPCRPLTRLTVIPLFFGWNTAA